MDIGPIFRALLRNKLGVVLIAAQIAFTLTVMVNAIYIISDRGRLMAIPSGMDDANLFHLTSIGFGENFNEADVVFNDLAMLRQTPGIVNATITNSIPVSSSGSSSGFTTEAGRRESTVGSAMYYVDEQALDTMGLELIAGRDFSASDMSLRNSGDTHFPDNIIVSLAFAEALFPGEGAQAAGRSIYTARDQPLRITGIVRQLQAPWPQSPHSCWCR